MPFKPKPPPVGVVPAGALEKIVTPSRGRGRPRRIQQDPAQGSSGSPEKTLLSDKGATAFFMASMAAEPSTIPFPTPKRVRQNAVDPRQEEVDQELNSWLDHFADSPNHRLTGDFGEDAGCEGATDALSDEDSANPEQLKDIGRTPGVEVKSSFLRVKRTSMTPDEGYEKSQKRVNGLIRFFDELVRSSFWPMIEADLRPHDYNLDSHVIYRGARLHWIDGPGLYPNDIRARRLSVKVPKSLVRSSPDRLIWRVSYSCNGACSGVIEKPSGPTAPALGVRDGLPLVMRKAAGKGAKRYEIRSKKRQQRESEPSEEEDAGEVKLGGGSNGDFDSGSVNRHPTSTPTPQPAKRASKRKRVQVGGGQRRPQPADRTLASGEDGSGSGSDGTPRDLEDSHESGDKDRGLRTPPRAIESDVFAVPPLPDDHEEEFDDLSSPEGGHIEYKLGESDYEEDSKGGDAQVSEHDKEHPSPVHRCGSRLVVRRKTGAWLHTDGAD